MTVVMTHGVRPAAGHPFFIVTPPYARISAGVTVLHLLCHYLNAQGHNAYILHYPPEQDGRGFLPSYARLQKTGEFPGGLNAPIVTQEVFEFYEKERLLPIVIYPEVFDNPLNATFFCRYLLNYPGLLAPHYEQEADFTFAYSRIVADHVGVDDVLYVPTVDLTFWNKKGAWAERTGACYYAGKLKQIHGVAPSEIPADSIEIPRGTEMTRERIRELFWKCEAFFCYEDTALATEAMICGCPTVFVPNEKFSGRPLATEELGSLGSCIYGEPGGLERARDTVEGFEAAVRSTFERVSLQTIRLAAKMLSLVEKQTYDGAFTYPFEPRLVFFDKISAVELGFRDGESMPSLALTESAGHSNLTTELDELRASYARADRDYHIQRSLAEMTAQESKRLRDEVAALRSSRSWRWTAPLRGLISTLMRRNK